MIQPSHSLVRYDNPVLISRTETSATKAGAKEGGVKKVPGAASSPGKKLPPVQDDKARQKTPTQTEDILNSILPPRYDMESERVVLCVFSLINIPG